MTKPVAKKKAAKKKAAAAKNKKPVLLSGGNPQIAKGAGDGPVQAYIAAMPGWKRDTGEAVDRVVTAALPGERV